MRLIESTCDQWVRQTQPVVVSLLLVVVGGCGAATLDTTNADTFELTFDAMMTDLPLAEQEALARAILTVHVDAERKRILPSALPKGRDAEALLDRRYRPELAREIIRSAGTVLDGKAAAELLAMGEEIAVKAAGNQVIWERERREQQAIREQQQADRRAAGLRVEISRLEGRLGSLRENLKDAQAERAMVQEEMRRDLAILEGVRVSLDGQRSTLEGGILRNEFDLTFTNETSHVIHEVTHGYDWTYGKCGGYAHVFVVQRLLRKPLEPKASVAVVAPAGHGGFMLDIRGDSGRTCPVTTEAEYRVSAVNASRVTYGEPPRRVSRQDIEMKLSRLDADVDSRRARVVSLQERIDEKVAALAALET